MRRTERVELGFEHARRLEEANTLFFERADETRLAGDAPDDDGTPSGPPTGEKVPFPVEQVESLYRFGEVDLNAKLVTFLAAG